jgi:Coenzyme F420-reducing hydrogenase, delta subunit
MNNNFEPRVIAFLCNWCGYAGADAAGNQHRPVPANIRVVRVLCAGRVDPQFILKAFKEGADGVMVIGCHPGECHYKEGAHNALRRAKLLEKLLFQFGIEKDRFHLDWVSASEGEKFARAAGAMVESIRKLGPLQPGLYKDFEEAEAAPAPAQETVAPEKPAFEKPAPEKPAQEKPAPEKPPEPKQAEISDKFDELLKDLNNGQ